MRFHLTVMRPPGTGRMFTQSFNEVVETLFYGLQGLGHEVTYKLNSLVDGAQNIVLGPHYVPRDLKLPAGTILYNLEQIGGAPNLLMLPELAKHYPVWDYSPANVACWHRAGVEAELVPIGYVKQLTRVPPVIGQDIDVLFYGSVSPRRSTILDQLQRRDDLKLVILLAFGNTRDAAIARAKVVLNLHYYDMPHLFEAPRVSYLLANQKCVVSETSDDFPAGLDGALRNAGHGELVDACRELVANRELRRRYEQEGFRLFSSRYPEREILRGPVSRLKPLTPSCPENCAASVQK